MRTARRVKQAMYYSLPEDKKPIYERDEQGNIIYDTMPDGEQVPRVVGESDIEFSMPIEFKNSITGNLTEEELLAFGNEPRMKAKMTYKKGEFPFFVGTKIWFRNEIEYEEGEFYPSEELYPSEMLYPNGMPTTESADYIVIGIQDTGRHFYKALLVKNV